MLLHMVTMFVFHSFCQSRVKCVSTLHPPEVKYIGSCYFTGKFIFVHGCWGFCGTQTHHTKTDPLQKNI